MTDTLDLFPGWGRYMPYSSDVQDFYVAWYLTINNLESRHLGVCCTDSDCYWPRPVAAGIPESNRLWGLTAGNREIRSRKQLNQAVGVSISFLKSGIPREPVTNSQTLFLMSCPLATERLQRNGVWLVPSSNLTIWEFLEFAHCKQSWGLLQARTVKATFCAQPARRNADALAQLLPHLLPTSNVRRNANGDGKGFWGFCEK